MIIMLVVIRCFIMVFEKMHMLASMNTSSLHHHFPKHTTDLEKMNKTRTDDYHYSSSSSSSSSMGVLKNSKLLS